MRTSVAVVTVIAAEPVIPEKVALIAAIPSPIAWPPSHATGRGHSPRPWRRSRSKSPEL